MAGSGKIFNIELDGENPALEDQREVSPRIGVITRQQAKPKFPHHFSTPTLSSSTSGIYSKSTESDPTDPTASPATSSLRSRRGKGLSRTVSEDMEEKVYAMSQASIPRDADSDTQSEQTPLMEGEGSVIAMSDDDDSVQSNSEGFGNLIKILTAIGIAAVCVGGILAFNSWYYGGTKIPEGFVSNTTEVIDTDANMDME